MVSNQVWGEVPDVTISFLPKFTLENRLPVSLDYRLALPYDAPRAVAAVPAADADADDAPASGGAAAAAAADEGGGADAAEPRVNPLVKLLLPLLRRRGDGAADAAADDADGAAAAPAAEAAPELPDVLRQLVVQHIRRPPRDSPPTCPRPQRGSV